MREGRKGLGGDEGGGNGQPKNEKGKDEVCSAISSTEQ